MWPKLCGNPSPKTLPASVFSFLSSLWIINDPFELQSCVNTKQTKAGCWMRENSKTFNLSPPTQHDELEFALQARTHCSIPVWSERELFPPQPAPKNLPTGVGTVIATASCSGFLRRQQNNRCQSALLVPAKLIIWWLWD